MSLRYFTLILTVVIITGASSCKKYLTETPNNALPSGQSIVDLGTARASTPNPILGAYDGVQNYYAGYFPTLGTITADNVVFNGTLSQYLQLDQNAIPPDNVTTVAAYQGIYKAINSANSVIAYVPAVTDPLLTATEKNSILGEAYFIRALGYFDLGRGWGGVQLQLKPTTNVVSLKGVFRSTLDATYQQVQSDLTRAEQLLPEDAATRNRAQKSTRKERCAHDLTCTGKNWDSAEVYASKVIGNPKYALVPNYATFFTGPFLSAESVFELTFSANDRNSFWLLWYPSSFNGQYTLKPSTAIISKLNDPNIGGSRKALIAGSGTNRLWRTL